MNTSRLRRAIEIMQDVEAKQLPFDMDYWLTHLDENTFPPFGVREHTCGTAACMFGWCALDEGFQKEGLRFYVNFYREYPNGENYEEEQLTNPTIAEQNRLIHEEGWQISSAGVSFEGRTGTGAAAKFFGISIAAADYLTLPDRYSSDDILPEDAIRHLENVLNGIFEEEEPDHEWPDEDHEAHLDEPLDDDVPF